MRFEEMELGLVAGQLGPDQQAKRNPAQAVWQAVILLAVSEALERRSIPGGAAASSQAASEAKHWIFNDEDFGEVCVLADLDAEWVRRKVREALNRNRGVQSISTVRDQRRDTLASATTAQREGSP